MNNIEIMNQTRDLMQGLNKAQKEAVCHTEGPLLIVAGAGTGKTKTLISRMAYIINNGLALPDEILMVTFTNKAANELKTRIYNLIDVDPSELSWVGTFHSTSAKILRREAEHVGLFANFSIIDDADQIKIIQTILTRNKIDKKEWTPRQLASLINHWKNDAKLPEDLNSQETKYFGGKALNLYTQYQKELQLSNCADFGDLILQTVKIFTGNEHLLELYQDKFFYIMVDEYQDTNIAQYQWLRLLTQKRKNVCCVGDDDQAIYSWRGAKPQIMLDFPKYYPETKICKLEENYRSTHHILDSAVSLIQKNLFRHEKSLRMPDDKFVSGHKVQIHSFDKLGDEPKFVANNIKLLREEGYSGKKFEYDEIAVAARTWSQTAEIEERFMEHQIPYRVVGGPKFYDRKEVKDAIAYLRLIHNPADGAAFDRIINTPPRGIGKVTVDKISNFASENQLSKMDAVRTMLEKHLPSGTAKKVDRFLNEFDNWRDLIHSKSSHWAQNINILYQQIGFPNYLKNNFPDDHNDRLDNLEKLSDMASRFDTLGEYIEHIGLLNEDIKSKDDVTKKVTLMTLHASKGSEYPVLHLIGWNEGGLPWIRSIEEEVKNRSQAGFRLATIVLEHNSVTISNYVLYYQLAKSAKSELQDQDISWSQEIDDLCNLVLGWDRVIPPKKLDKEKSLAKKILASERLEEERRLAHVGITRVKELCIISYSTIVLHHGLIRANLLPSRFIRELDAKNIVFYKNGRLMSPTINSNHRSPLRTKPDTRARGKNNINNQPYLPINSSKILEGNRVQHPVFGQGTVVAASNNRLMIRFDDKTEKLLLSEYVQKV